jgi:iron(III) transport system substrate-binding protein
MKIVCALARGAVVVSAIAAAGSAFAQSGDVNVYTYRESKLIQPLFDAFSRDTGVKVNVISASSGLEQRIKAEGANSPRMCCSPSISGESRTPCERCA